MPLIAHFVIKHNLNRFIEGNESYYMLKIFLYNYYPYDVTILNNK